MNRVMASEKVMSAALRNVLKNVPTYHTNAPAGSPILMETERKASMNGSHPKPETYLSIISGEIPSAESLTTMRIVSIVKMPITVSPKVRRGFLRGGGFWGYVRVIV